MEQKAAATGHAPTISEAQVRGAYRRTPAWKVIGATMVKNLQVQRRYLPNLIGYVVQMAIRFLFFLLLSGFVTYTGPNQLSGHQLFIFFLAGLVLMVFNGTALNMPLNTVTGDLMNGTLEYLYSNPIARYPYYMGTVLASTVIDLTFFVPLYLLLVWMAGVNAVAMLYILGTCMVVLCTMMALGNMIALLGLLWRQAASIAGILGLLFEFLAGAYMPVTQFPKVIEFMAYLLPYTWGYDLIRFYGLQGEWQTILPVWAEWVVLVVQALIFTGVAIVLLNRVEMRVKKNGLHLI